MSSEIEKAITKTKDEIKTYANNKSICMNLNTNT